MEGADVTVEGVNINKVSDVLCTFCFYLCPGWRGFLLLPVPNRETGSGKHDRGSNPTLLYNKTK